MVVMAGRSLIHALYVAIVMMVIQYDLYQTVTEYDSFILPERTGMACLFSIDLKFVCPSAPAIDINNRFIMLMRVLSKA